MSQNFEEFGLPAKLVKALTRIGYQTPTPIQDQTIPLALQGKDILGSAQTGTGKTAAFGIPMIVHLMENQESTALVMTPTRELAAQVQASLLPLLPHPMKTALLIGGDSMFKQLNQLKQAPRLIIGTPGRINDHLARGTLNLSATSFMVLDETDRMLDMGFGQQIDKILTFMPRKRQTLLFSATLPPNIIKLSSKYMHHAERVAIGSTTTPASNIQQELVHTTDTEKFPQLLDQLSRREGSVIIFVKTKYGTEKLAKRLVAADHLAEAIHGDLQQRRRDRVIRHFREQKYRILVATDIAARGLDIPHIEHVINYDLPQCPEDYIHRIGRTARAGAEGSAINLLTPADGSKWKAIHRLIHGKEDSAYPGPAPTKPSKKYKSQSKGKRKWAPTTGEENRPAKAAAKPPKGKLKKPAWKGKKPHPKAGGFKNKKAA
ncbi:MAG: DEAD/DEAH box helicase [Bdellovibrionales bacterium]